MDLGSVGFIMAFPLIAVGVAFLFVLCLYQLVEFFSNVSDFVRKLGRLNEKKIRKEVFEIVIGLICFFVLLFGIIGFGLMGAANNS